MQVPASRQLHRLSNSNLQLANDSQDVRDRSVLDRNGDEIGTVSDLLIDEQERKVRFLEVSAGGFLGIGSDKLLVPVDAVTRVDANAVHIDQSRDRIAGAPRYDPDLVDQQQYYGDLYGYYGYGPYWTPGYTYPPLYPW